MFNIQLDTLNMKKTKILNFTLLTIAFACLFSSFKINESPDVSGSWVLTKATFRDLLNNNISFDSAKTDYGYDDMVIHLYSGKYLLLESSVFSDSSTYRVTDNKLFFESGTMSPNNFNVEKITSDSLVLYNELSYYVNDDSTYVTKIKFHFRKQLLE